MLVDTRSGKRRAVELGASPVLVGSGVDCDVVVPSADVPEHACRATAGPEGIVLESLDPRGFVLNERPAKGAILHPGDVVKLGPFQLVAAGAPAAGSRPPAEPRPAALGPAVPAAPALTAEQREARAAVREQEFASRRRSRRGNERFVGGVVLIALGCGAYFLWEKGWFSQVFGTKGDSSSSGAPSPASNGAPSVDPSGSAPVEGGRSGVPIAPGGGTKQGGASPEARKLTTHKDVTETIAKVDRLLEAEEFARCRWLLYVLQPTDEADKKRVEKRRKEVDAAAKKGAKAHLDLVADLIQRGRLPTALGHCEEDAISRFRGLPEWYRMLEKADEIEVLLDQRVEDALRPKAKRKHARPMPPDLESRPPPPVETSETEQLLQNPKAMTEKSEPRPSRPSPRPERPAGGATSSTAPEAAPDRAAPPAPPSAEQLAAQAMVVAALQDLAAAKPAAMEAPTKKLVESVRAAKDAAVAPLLARCEEIAAALEAAPEKAALAELRQRVQSLAEARVEALKMLGDENRYVAGDAAAQKEVEKLVGAVRAIWGNEQGSAPAPQVALGADYTRLVHESRLLDSLLAELGQRLPDRAELLGTRLLPLWAPKVTVRNYALTLDERTRLDADRETRTRNQQVKEVKDSDDLSLLFLANDYRDMLGRPQLVFDKKLYDEAREYADLMAKQLKGAKDSDPQPECTPRVAGSKAKPGTNCLRGSFSAKQALQAWGRNVIAHRNLIDLAHKTMGAANVGNFWSVSFGLVSDAGGKK